MKVDVRFFASLATLNNWNSPPGGVAQGPYSFLLWQLCGLIAVSLVLSLFEYSVAKSSKSWILNVQLVPIKKVGQSL